MRVIGNFLSSEVFVAYSSYTCIHMHVSYFEGSDSDSDGGAVEGESEEAVRKRIAAEYQNEGVWSKTGSGNDQGADEPEGEDDDDDPLDAFMAGIEVHTVH